MKRKSDNDEDTVAQITRIAVELDLTALAHAIPQLLLQAEQDGISYTDFARTVFDCERRARLERKLQRGLKLSRLGPVEGLEGFDFSKRPQLEPRVVKELLACRFVQENRNIICVGRPGLGKTRIAKAIAHAACLRGLSVLFTTAVEMLEDLQGAHAVGTFKRAFRRYTKPALLAVDEFGYQPFDTKQSGYLFRLVSARHKDGSIVLTANTGFSKWSSFFPTEGHSIATLDRLIGRATILRFTGKSFRQPKDIHGAPLDE
jgi:DNA replication protein DnaC